MRGKFVFSLAIYLFLHSKGITLSNKHILGSRIRVSLEEIMSTESLVFDDEKKDKQTKATKTKTKTTPNVKPPGNLLTPPTLMAFIKEATARRELAEEKKAKKLMMEKQGYKMLLEKEKKEQLLAQGKEGK